MEIQKQEKYRVGSSEFDSLQQAEHYHGEINRREKLFNFNSSLLDDYPHGLVPVEIDGEIDLFLRQCSNGQNPWTSIIKEQDLRYYTDESEKIKILTPNEWLTEFYKTRPIISAANFSLFISSVLKLAKRAEDVDYRQLCEAIGKLQIEAEYCYRN